MANPSHAQYMASPYGQYGGFYGATPYGGFGGISPYGGFGGTYGMYGSPYGNTQFGGFYGGNPYGGFGGTTPYGGFGGTYGMYGSPYGNTQFSGFYGGNPYGGFGGTTPYGGFGGTYGMYGSPYANTQFGGFYGNNPYGGFGGMYGMYGMYGGIYGNTLYGGYYGSNLYGGITSVSMPDSSIDADIDISVNFNTDDLDFSSTGSGMSYITLNGDSIYFSGVGAIVSGHTITITSAGMYSISGTLFDGQIIVDTQDEETVKLVLNEADIYCSTSAPIYIMSAKDTVITLADGTENYVTDGGSYIFEDPASDEPNATIFSKDDLTINGYGSLIVNANYNDGITSKDDLKITGGTITVYTENDGIRGKDFLAVKDGTITVEAEGDGLQSNNDSDPDKGFVYIEGGTFDINAESDGIQAHTTVFISGGDFKIRTGGGSNKNTDDSDTAKGIKAGVNVTIEDGEFHIDSSDDAIHSNDTIIIDGGDFTLKTADDGIHADYGIEINGGDIVIKKCFEGIESEIIIINDGDIEIASSEDGINVVSADQDSSQFGGPFGGPGQMSNTFSDDYYLYINGGEIVIDAVGDGIDINGSAYMTDGSLIINGPTSNMNGAVDCSTFYISDGFLVAVGSSGMAMAPSASSKQYSVMVNLQVSRPAGATVNIRTQNGNEILTFEPTKTYQSVVFSSPDLKMGTTYSLYSGGSLITNFTISSMVTTIGNTGGFPGGGGPPF